MKTLLLIDLQNDFLPTGMLPVPQGDQVLAPAIRAMQGADHIIASQDWHPADHQSFAANHPWRKPGQIIQLHGLSQVLWPIHCVQNSFGAEFAPELPTDQFDHIVQKGTNPEIDSYSAFFDNGHRQSTGLAEYLRSKEITKLAMGGLATDYCVKFTVLDALAEGFEVTVLTDLCKGIELTDGDIDLAWQEMEAHGAALSKSDEWLLS